MRLWLSTAVNWLSGRRSARSGDVRRVRRPEGNGGGPSGTRTLDRRIKSPRRVMLARRGAYRRVSPRPGRARSASCCVLLCVGEVCTGWPQHGHRGWGSRSRVRFDHAGGVTHARGDFGASIPLRNGPCRYLLRSMPRWNRVPASEPCVPPRASMVGYSRDPGVGQTDLKSVEQRPRLSVTVRPYLEQRLVCPLTSAFIALNPSALLSKLMSKLLSGEGVGERHAEARF